MQTLHTDILGVDYEVQVGKCKELDMSKDFSGQCAHFLKKIMIEHSMRDCDTEKERDGRTSETVAHEIFHAFVNESGLDLTEETEERLAVWFSKQWRKMNNSICGILDSLGLLDI